MSQTSVQYACVVNYNTGGRIFVEAGNPGDKLRLNGFISAIVNKRPDPKGSFNQGETTFSYLKEGKLAFVSVSHPSVENDVIWGFLNELSSTKTEDKLPLQEALNQALHKYQGVKLSTQGTGLKSHEPVPVKEVVPEADPLTLVSNFFASVHDKMQKRDPAQSPNPLKHLLNVVNESYTEQGGKEGLDKVVKHVIHLTNQEFTKIDQEIQKRGGLGHVIQEGFNEVSHNSLEAGGIMLDHFEEFEKVVKPLAQQANATLVESTVKAGSALSKFQEDWAKGTIQEKIMADTEKGLAHGLEIYSALSQVTEQIKQDAKTKGFSEAFSSGIATLIGKQDDKDDDDFD
eukprot:TRINITY_DN216_c0_g2_i1.p1 TRINITY_DN216_c0_g2~~TRINITY_DN216_c0_g2_i1.p1  ORF type:complete len:363 (-),score=97.62 TRINITY_DN216_c0_g2_i1:178-1209(-)